MINPIEFAALISAVEAMARATPGKAITVSSPDFHFSGILHQYTGEILFSMNTGVMATLATREEVFTFMTNAK
jgi:nitrous oxidase accessory protein NosD